MHLSRLLTLFGLLTSSTYATPNNIHQRASCNEDKCLQAAQSPGKSAALASCASFLRKTVSLCPTTTTRTKTVTRTAPPTTITKTGTAFSTEVDTTTETILSTSFTTTTQTINEIDSETTVSTTLTTYTTSTTTTVTNLQFKRDMTHDEGPTTLAPRATSSCQPVTTSANSVPKYASRCNDVAKLSSACSCLGASPSTTTLRRKTVHQRTTVTHFITPTITKQTVLTVPTTTLTTSLTTASFSTTLTSLLTTTTSTSTSTTTTTSTTSQTAVATYTSGNFALYVDGLALYAGFPARTFTVGDNKTRYRYFALSDQGFLRDAFDLQYYTIAVPALGSSATGQDDPGAADGAELDLNNDQTTAGKRLICSLWFPGRNGGRLTCSVSYTPAGGEGGASEVRTVFARCGDFVYFFADGAVDPECTEKEVFAGLPPF